MNRRFRFANLAFVAATPWLCMVPRANCLAQNPSEMVVVKATIVTLDSMLTIVVDRHGVLDSATRENVIAQAGKAQSLGVMRGVQFATSRLVVAGEFPRLEHVRPTPGDEVHLTLVVQSRGSLHQDVFKKLESACTSEGSPDTTISQRVQTLVAREITRVCQSLAVRARYLLAATNWDTVAAVTLYSSGTVLSQLVASGPSNSKDSVCSMPTRPAARGDNVVSAKASNNVTRQLLALCAIAERLMASNFASHDVVVRSVQVVPSGDKDSLEALRRRYDSLGNAAVKHTNVQVAETIRDWIRSFTSPTPPVCLRSPGWPWDTIPPIDEHGDRSRVGILAAADNIREVGLGLTAPVRQARVLALARTVTPARAPTVEVGAGPVTPLRAIGDVAGTIGYSVEKKHAVVGVIAMPFTFRDWQAGAHVSSQAIGVLLGYRKDSRVVTQPRARPRSRSCSLHADRS